MIIILPGYKPEERDVFLANIHFNPENSQNFPPEGSDDALHV
jgi:hypothetical protein